VPNSSRRDKLRLTERARIRLRVATARPLRLRPTFLVLGAQKAGTTALHRYLQMHEAVLCARMKEVDYFDHSYVLGDSWYLTHFPLFWARLSVRRKAGIEAVVGELSPDYLLYPRVPERVHRFDPSMRLVVLLRDPVERAYSHYEHERRRCREPLSFEEALEQEDERLAPEFERMLSEPDYSSVIYRRYSYLARGRYWEQLERWFAIFPREQLLVLESGSLRVDTRARMSEVSSFLGVPESRAESYPEIGVTDYARPLEPAIRDWLARYFEPHNRRLYELLGRDLRWTRPSLSEDARSSPMAA
jgi:hypothetical protein